ncbi:unnamed protein product [Rotaria sordida]|uniref:Uncharacterized protein n=1 Tax=Rotaria sordida TaxID=392033 RepID=A0A814JPQ0_9BILA|nr:unnamed protein product [Rotaria sordida]
MSNIESSGQTRTFYKEIDEMKDEKLWENLDIVFCREAMEFPDNKIYATIKIEPESARRLIEKFFLIVNKCYQVEFDSSYQYISASGFDVIKQEKQIDVKIQAIPLNKDWRIKESKSCSFFFNGQIFALSPIIRFDHNEKDPSTFNVIIKWYHIGDRYAQKYIVCLDEKEIHYINQSSIHQEMLICIHYLQPGEKHTVQIIATLKNARVTYSSDLINFTVPNEKTHLQNHELINICDEPVPSHLLGVIVKDEDIKKTASGPERNRFKERALELLRLLQKQTEARRKL